MSDRKWSVGQLQQGDTAMVKLAKVCIPPGDQCLGVGRLEQLGEPDATFAEAEAKHLQECNWCRYLWLNGESRCIAINRLHAISMGGQATKDERQHLAECPACSYECRELRKDAQKRGVFATAR
jgi:hypothetical protein